MLHNLSWAAFSLYWSFGVLHELRGPHVTCTCGEEDDAIMFSGVLLYAALVLLSALGASGVLRIGLRQRGILSAIFQTTLAILLTIPALGFLCSPGGGEDANTLLMTFAVVVGAVTTSAFVWWKYRTGRSG
jgi:hypothetical protein